MKDNITRELLSRFNAKYIIDEDTGCWNWTDRLNGVNGYGKIWTGTTDVRAHRFSYESNVGHIGELHVLHRCDNPKCVNPDHLFLGTNKQNQEDKVTKGRQRSHKGVNNPNAKLTEEDIVLIRNMLIDNYSLAHIAREFNVSSATISNYKQLGD